MTHSECLECTDCLDHYCSVCDVGGNCPDCMENMCEDCYQWSHDDDRQGRCYLCCQQPYDDNVAFHGTDKRLCKKQTRIHTGKLK